MYGLFGPDLHSQMVRSGAAPGDLSSVTGIVQSYVSVGNTNGFNPGFAQEVISKATNAYVFSYRLMMLIMAAVVGLFGLISILAVVAEAVQIQQIKSSARNSRRTT